MSLLWKLRWNWLKIKDQRSRRRAQAESRESMSESSSRKARNASDARLWLLCAVVVPAAPLPTTTSWHYSTVPNNSTSSSTSPWLCATDETTLIYYLDAIAFCCGILVKQNHPTVVFGFLIFITFLTWSVLTWIGCIFRMMETMIFFKVGKVVSEKSVPHRQTDDRLVFFIFRFWEMIHFWSIFNHCNLRLYFIKYWVDE